MAEQAFYDANNAPNCDNGPEMQIACEGSLGNPVKSRSSGASFVQACSQEIKALTSEATMRQKHQADLILSE